MGLKQEEGQSLANWVNLDPNSPDARLAMADYYRVIMITILLLTSIILPYNLHRVMLVLMSHLVVFIRVWECITRQKHKYQQVLQTTADNITTQLLLAQTYQKQGDINSALQNISIHSPDK
jgi:thioredoxin-like negative regulator of GroEL